MAGRAVLLAGPPGTGKVSFNNSCEITLYSCVLDFYLHSVKKIIKQK